MQHKKILLAIISLGLIFASSVFAQDMTEFQKQMMQKMMQQTMQKTQSGGTQPPGFAAIDVSNEGKALFNDPGLGTNGKSCGSCHQEGKKPLDGQRVDNHLVAYVQYCYEHAIGGNKVINKEKLSKIMAYLNSLGKKPNPSSTFTPPTQGEEAW